KDAPEHGPAPSPAVPSSGARPCKLKRKIFDMPPLISRALALACLLAAASVGSLLAAADDATVLATVNGKPITEGDLMFADEEVGQQLASVPPNVKRRYLLEYLIETQLMASAAEADKLDSGPEWEKRLAYVQRRAKREAYFEKSVRSQANDAAARELYDQQ